jgi:hypothetical protein
LGPVTVASSKYLSKSVFLGSCVQCAKTYYHGSYGCKFNTTVKSVITVTNIIITTYTLATGPVGEG